MTTALSSRICGILLIISGLYGCRNDQSSEIKILELENANRILLNKIQQYEAFHLKQSDSSCFLPNPVVQCDKTVLLGDSFQAKIALNEVPFQSKMKIAFNDLDSTELNRLSIQYDSESYTIKIATKTKGKKQFEGILLVPPSFKYPFSIQYEVE